MAGNILLKEVSAITLEGNGASTSTNNEVEANDAQLDNRSGGNAAQAFFASFELVVGFGSAPAAGVAIELYLVPALDGTNYAEIDTTNHLLQAANFRGSFVVLKAQTGTQRLVLEGVMLQPLLYKAYLLNKTAQTMSSGWTLKAVVAQGQYT